MALPRPDANPRLTRRQAENARAAIKVGLLIRRLHDNAMGKLSDSAGKKITLNPSQVKSAQILLNKTLPDMQQVEYIEDLLLLL